ncbi:MAG: Hpt domain-containing protein [Candidatus Hodarchaeales archaeon]
MRNFYETILVKSIFLNIVSYSGRCTMFSFDDEMFEVFLEELTGRLDQYRKGLTLLRSNPTDKEALEEFHQVFHTLKSDSSYFPLEEFSQFMRRACDFTRNIPEITIDEKLLLFLQETESYLSQYLNWLPKRSGEKPLLGDLENRLVELETAQGKPQVHDSEAEEEEKRGFWKSIKSLLGFRKKSQ